MLKLSKIDRDYLETHIQEESFRGDMCFTIVTRVKDTHQLYRRVDQPCYGEMRAYGKLSKNRPGDPRPNDLFHPFPQEGTPEYLAVPFFSKLHENPEVHNRFISAILGEDTPYRRGLSEGGFEFPVDSDGFYRGVIQHGGSFDPTVFVASLILLRNLTKNTGELFAFLEEAFPDVPVSSRLLACASTQIHGTKVYRPHLNDYYLSRYLEIKRFLTGDTVDVTGGTWGDRFDYNRPELHMVFGRAETCTEDILQTGFPGTSTEMSESRPLFKTLFDNIAKHS